LKAGLALQPREARLAGRADGTRRANSTGNTLGAPRADRACRTCSAWLTISDSGQYPARLSLELDKLCAESLLDSRHALDRSCAQFCSNRSRICLDELANALEFPFLVSEYPANRFVKRAN
jgi:hypothetical protein